MSPTTRCWGYLSQVDTPYQLIAGQRRLKACESLGWGTVPVHVVPIDDIVRGELDENVVRQDFLPSERYVIAKKLEKRERKAAKERKARPGQARSGKFPQQAEKGKSRDKMGKRAGISGRTLDKISERRACYVRSEAFRLRPQDGLSVTSSGFQRLGTCWGRPAKARLTWPSPNL